MLKIKEIREIKSCGYYNSSGKKNFIFQFALRFCDLIKIPLKLLCFQVIQLKIIIVKYYIASLKILEYEKKSYRTLGFLSSTE